MNGRLAALAVVLVGTVGTPGRAVAATAQVTLEVSSRRLTTDDELRITVRTSGSYDQVTELAADGFELRQAGHQQQLSLIGRQMQQTESLLYVATPQRAGKFTVGPVMVLQGGQVVAKSDAISVEVVELKEELPVTTVERATELTQYVGQPFFVHPTVSVSQPFVGQPFVVTYALYWSRQRSVAGIRATSDPRYDKLEPESLLGKEGEKGEPVYLSGQPYQRQITHRDMLVAGVPGPLLLEGPRFRIDSLDGRAQKVLPATMTMQVRALPKEGVPAGFYAGNVGRLRLAGTLRSTQPAPAPHPGGGLHVQTGERALLTFTVSGDGNLYGVRPPELPHLPGMHAQVVPTRDDEGITRTATGVQGQRTWQWMLTFDQPGKVQVPAMTWASFDPVAEKFELQSAGPFDVTVEGPAMVAAAGASEDATSTSDATPHTRGQLAADILRPLATQATLAAPTARPWTDSLVFRFLALAPLGAVLAALLLAWRRRQQEKLAPDRARADALPLARSTLTSAASQEPGAGYALMRQAVTDYLAAVGGLASAGLTEQAMVAALTAKQIPADVARDLAADLQHCDFARFAPAGDRQADLAQTAERLTSHLAKLDSIWRAQKRDKGVTGAVAVVIGAAMLASLTCQSANAATLDQSFQSANALYTSGDYAGAVRQYQELLVHDLAVPAVQYNLGNAYVHLHHPGRAIAAYQSALRLGPDPVLRANIVHNMAAVRAELTDHARRHHATLHVFDESAGLDVLLSEEAPRGALGGLIVLSGWAAALLLAGHLRQKSRPRWWVPLAVASAVAYGLGAGFLWWVDHTRDTVVQAIVVEEDAQLTACVPGGDEDLGLPEGLEVRRLGETADGRVQVRLPNGREGCLQPSAVLVQGSASR